MSFTVMWLVSPFVISEDFAFPTASRSVVSRSKEQFNKCEADETPAALETQA